VGRRSVGILPRQSAPAPVAVLTFEYRSDPGGRRSGITPLRRCGASIRMSAATGWSSTSLSVRAAKGTIGADPGRRYAVEVSVGVAVAIVVGCALLLTVVVLLARLLRTPERLWDLQYALFLSGRRSVVAAVVVLLLVLAFDALFGVALLADGDVLGWAFIPPAILVVVVLAFCVSVARLPFHPPEDDGTPSSQRGAHGVDGTHDS
jgi:hypothetical protein